MSPQSFPSITEQPIPTGRFKPLVSLLKYKWLALLILVTMGALSAHIFSKQGTPIYQVSSRLLVSPKFTPNLNAERGMDLDRTEYQLYIKQQINLITRRDVLQEALQIPQLRDNWLLPGEKEGDAQKRLAKALSIKYKRSDPYLIVNLQSDKRPGLDIILNSFIEVYLKKSQEENIFDSIGRIERLDQRRQELEQLILEQEQHRFKIAIELGVTTFTDSSSNPYDNILIESRQAHAQAHRQLVEVETQLATLKKKQSNGDTILDILVDEAVNNDSTLKSFTTRLTERRTQLLTETLGLTPQHPTRQRADQEIIKIDQDIEQATRQLTEDIRNRILEKSKADVYQAQSIEQALARELQERRQQANHYAKLYNEALVLSRDITRSIQELEKIDGRIDFLSIESTAPGFVRVDTPAEEATSPVASNHRQILLLLIAATLGLGIGIPILIDWLDRRIRTPGEVHKLLGFSPMAWILERRDKHTQRFAADQMRRMVLALERDWHTHNTNHFVLTSVKARGGTTTLTLELAALLTDLGMRTLAVELNAFKPDSRYNDTSSSTGLTTLLNQDNFDPMMFIRPATDTLPDRLPVGETSQPHLVTQGKLRPLLKQLNTHYDLILIDTPPILLSADAELLGEVAGGILLIIEAEHIMPGELKRAAHLLERLNPPVMGSVLNRVKIYRGGGYFAELLKEYEKRDKSRGRWVSRFFGS